MWFLALCCPIFSGAAQKIAIDDQTQQADVALRRSIYLTIMSSLDFEECAHKICKIQLKPGQEVIIIHMWIQKLVFQNPIDTLDYFLGFLLRDVMLAFLTAVIPWLIDTFRIRGSFFSLQTIVCKMILECCMQERTFLKFYGLLGERFCRISAAFQDSFDDLFAIQVYYSNQNIKQSLWVFHFWAYFCMLDWLWWSPKYVERKW